MVKINKIYTRSGDGGETHLVGGRKVSKTSQRVVTYGVIDELNAAVGCVYTWASLDGLSDVEEKLKLIQNELFDIGSELATAPGDEWEGMILIGSDSVDRFESWIDDFTTELPELKSFVLPGGTKVNALLHLARTVCRRAEISVLKLAEEGSVRDEIMVYMNRLSDLLFAMSRYAAKQAGVEEHLWKPGG